MLAAMSAAEEPGAPVHYTTVAPGTPVYGSGGERVGTVRRVVDNYREHILDGIVIEDGEGEVRFVDAPEVERTYENAVTLTIGPAEVGALPPPHGAAASISDSLGAGRLVRRLSAALRRR